MKPISILKKTSTHCHERGAQYRRFVCKAFVLSILSINLNFLIYVYETRSDISDAPEKFPIALKTPNSTIRNTSLHHPALPDGLEVCDDDTSFQENHAYYLGDLFMSLSTSGRVPLNQMVERKIQKAPPRLKYRCATPEADLIAEKNTSSSPARYIVLNEPRSGSSWLQEISMMHPGVMVQFELDYLAGDAALSCQQCHRPSVPNSKNASRLPAKVHPPLACGMTMFGGNNRFADVSSLAARHNASLVVLLRRDHLAHAVSGFLHFEGPRLRKLAHARGQRDYNVSVPWDAHQLKFEVEQLRQSYERLTMFPAETGRPAHFIFYEDLRDHPEEVWARLQGFLGLPHAAVPGLRALERRATSKPSAMYLERFRELRGELRGTPLGAVLEDAAANAAANATAAAPAPAGPTKAAADPLGGGGGILAALLRRLGRGRGGGGGDGGGNVESLGPEPAAAAAVAAAANPVTGPADMAVEFGGLCARFPEAGLSWRGGRCRGGRAVAW